MVKQSDRTAVEDAGNAGVVIQAAESLANAVAATVKAFDPDVAFAELQKFQAQTKDHDNKFAAPGRERYYELHAISYGMFHQAMAAEPHLRSLLMDKLKASLGDRVKSSTRFAGMFIRFAWDGTSLTDSKVSKAAAVYEVAEAVPVDPSEFVSWVKKKGGFAGISAGGGGSNERDATAIEGGVSLARQQAMIAEAFGSKMDWSAGGTFRLVLASKNGDETVDLHDLPLTPEALDQAILLFKKDQEDLAKLKAKQAERAKLGAAVAVSAQMQKLKERELKCKEALDAAQFKYDGLKLDRATRDQIFAARGILDQAKTAHGHAKRELKNAA